MQPNKPKTDQKPTVHLATDHAGFVLKNELKEFLTELGHVVIDHGAHEYVKTDSYVPIIARCCRAMRSKPKDKAIILGGSGQGEAMTANRFAWIRATTYYGGNSEIIKLSKHHNDANVLSVGARFVELFEIRLAVKEWLETPFPGESRHRDRVDQLGKIQGNLATSWILDGVISLLAAVLFAAVLTSSLDFSVLHGSLLGNNDLTTLSISWVAIIFVFLAVLASLRLIHKS